MAYWGPRRYRYYDPLQAVIECGERPTREKAVAALVAASRMLGAGAGATAFSLVVLVFFVIVGFFIFSGWTAVGVPPGFAAVPLVFVLFSVGFAALVLRAFMRGREASRALQELARMVQSGLVAPEDVCGLTVAAAVELYKMKSSGLPSEPPV